MALLSDTGWQYTSFADPRRGWHDESRVLVRDEPWDAQALADWLVEECYCFGGQLPPTLAAYASDGLTHNYTFSRFTDSGD